jgi:hypothetical protein
MHRRERETSTTMLLIQFTVGGSTAQDTTAMAVKKTKFLRLPFRIVLFCSEHVAAATLTACLPACLPTELCDKLAAAM